MFKQQFKYYKSKCPSPNFDDVVDFKSTPPFKIKVREHQVVCNRWTNSDFIQLGLRPLNEWNIYEFEEKPGLIFIRNPFTNLGQRCWIYRCLADYPKKPSKLNVNITENDWCSMYHLEPSRNELLKKLRWATLGYHHNWNTKVYSDDDRTPLPEDLAKLSQVVATCVTNYSDFEAQAVIVNYYHLDSTLSGHRDVSEHNFEAPLLSFSFGQSAIFLLGGNTIEEAALPVFIHSGDIIVMSSQARLLFHGVPRILHIEDDSPWENVEKVQNTEKDSNNINFTESYEQAVVPADVSHVAKKCVYSSDVKNSVFLSDEIWKYFNQFLETCRININVRQVLFPGQYSLHCPKM